MGRRSSKVEFAASKILLRDLRKPGWSWFQNELLDFFAPLIGPYAVVVYLSLCREASRQRNEAVVEVSLRDLEDVWRRSGLRPALSKTSIHRALRLLVNAGLTPQLNAASNRAPATYGLRSLAELAVELTDAHCDSLALALEHQRQRVSGVPVGNAKKLLKSSGEACGNDPISTSDPGTPGFPTGPLEVSHGNSLLLRKKESIKNPPVVPQGTDFQNFFFANPDQAQPIVRVAIKQAWHHAESLVRDRLCVDCRPARKQRQAGCGATDWEYYFRDMALDGWHEAAGKVIGLYVSHPRPGELQTGLVLYRKTWKRALSEALCYVTEIHVSAPLEGQPDGQRWLPVLMVEKPHTLGGMRSA